MEIVFNHQQCDPSGYGSGYGSGYADGYGYGSGSGYGDGYADGSGSGSGYGDGYGYADGDGKYNKKALHSWVSKLPQEQQSRFSDLDKSGARFAYWKSNKDGRAANGGTCDPVRPGTIHEECGPLSLCSRGTLHATLLPDKWKGERLWIVALIGEVQGDDEKLGALKREIIGECV